MIIATIAHGEITVHFVFDNVQKLKCDRKRRINNE